MSLHSVGGESPLRTVLARLLIAYSYLFHLMISLILIGLAVVTINGGQDNLKFGVLPWEGAALTHWILGLGITGLIITLLTILGPLRLIFPLWALLVAVQMFRGFFLPGTFQYTGMDEFKGAIWLTAGALVAFLCSLLLYRRLRPVERKA